MPVFYRKMLRACLSFVQINTLVAYVAKGDNRLDAKSPSSYSTNNDPHVVEPSTKNHNSITPSRIDDMNHKSTDPLKSLKNRSLQHPDLFLSCSPIDSNVLILFHIN
ncbi:hypothetical protein PGTUg99_010768 [Puccinia graminis f. sp. tritici]|uniref:Uncharacterized protein n=1 Tax=Puccinia graminis f. sp. tritici TaxID=56615 RepID=A0A5B0SGM8_PUCGR|nr:hypothetical protein PGTUg99_010768 [Puccinia graminis f. sp. tritici]